MPKQKKQATQKKQVKQANQPKQKKQPNQEKKAQQGEKMIEVRVRFWTNDIAKQKGQIVAKKCHPSGMVHISPNKSHGIKASKGGTVFNSALGLPGAIEKELKKHGVKFA